MSLSTTIAEGFARSLTDSLEATREIAEGLSEEQFWTKPYPYGNSIGHLVLHVTGNLSYYIGTVIANTGYVRDRPREFTDSKPPSKEEALQRLADTVAMVIATLRSQSEQEWSAPYEATNVPDFVETRYDMILRCTTHFDHHVGQMMYLKKEREVRSEEQEQGRFDFEGFKHAFMEQDLERWIEFYADDAEWIEYSHANPPSSPRRIVGRNQIRAYLEEIVRDDITLTIDDEVVGRGRAAFCVRARLGDGRGFIENTVIDYVDGRITRMVDVETWDGGDKGTA